MPRGLPARHLNQCWVGGDNAENFVRAQEQQASPPAVMNTPGCEIAEVIAIQQITARNESAHDLVASAANIALPAQANEHVRNHDQIERVGRWISLQVPFREGDVAELPAPRARSLEG